MRKSVYHYYLHNPFTHIVFRLFTIKTLLTDITTDKSNMMKDTVEKIAKLMGPTRNYG